MRNALAFLVVCLALALVACPFCWTFQEVRRHQYNRDVDMAREGYEQSFEQGPIRDYQPGELLWRKKK